MILKELARVISTFATRTFFRCTLLYKEGYCTAKGASPNQISAQKQRVDPFLILNDPLLKKSFSILISSFQNGELVGFASTCAKVLPRHLSSPMMHLLHFFHENLKKPKSFGTSTACHIH
jgi:hypothetical protein